LFGMRGGRKEGGGRRKEEGVKEEGGRREGGRREGGGRRGRGESRYCEPVCLSFCPEVLFGKWREEGGRREEGGGKEERRREEGGKEDEGREEGGGRRKGREGKGKKEEGQGREGKVGGKREAERGKKEEERGKREEGRRRERKPELIFFFKAVLVVSCPCALGLAAPMALLVGTTVASRQGLLFKGGQAVEALTGAQIICFDKTGTLTTGSLSVTNILLYNAVARENFFFGIFPGVSQFFLLLGGRRWRLSRVHK
jgi:hypothetical protein